MPERVEVWLANLNPRRGTEPGKTHPVLIVQAQALIDAGHPSTLIVPLTTNLIDDAEPLRIRVRAQSSLLRDSELLIDQLRAIDNPSSSKARWLTWTRRRWRVSPPRCARYFILTEFGWLVGKLFLSAIEIAHEDKLLLLS